ncbi:MAG: GntR family transcriptional regulator [Alphaproteobacteria bacterium]|nr:GntR family transcriptional regulator [Alphaproteobacteria bacterium]
MSFDFAIDPDLPLPLGVQLRGLIEYGVTTGELAPGSRLPSVRVLAELAGISPMTVSQVYKDLQETGLIEGRRGQGTYVRTDASVPLEASGDLKVLQGQVDELIRAGLDRGFATADLARLFSARLSRLANNVQPMHVVLVGVFENATRDYVADLRAHLAPGDRATGVTIDQLEADPDLCRSVAKANLVLAFANRKPEIADLLHTKAPIMAVSYVPSDKTRLELAGLGAMERVGLVSTFVDFLPIMKSGVHRLAPQLDDIQATALEHDDVSAMIRTVDVVIYATGSEEVVGDLPSGTRSFEYRHALNPHEIRSNVLPMLEHLRSQDSPEAQQTQNMKEAI